MPSVAVIHKFGREDLSDVVFLVGDHKFHCHKMFLAVRSDFFAGMFCSSFRESNESSIKIDACPIAFKNLMEIIYNGRMENDEDLFVCNSHEKLGIDNGDLNIYLWKVVIALFALADRFLLTDIVRYSIESSLLCYDHNCPYTKSKCYHCAVKLLLALRFGMDNYKMINVSTKSVICTASERLDECDLGLSSQALCFLLKSRKRDSDRDSLLGILNSPSRTDDTWE